MKDPTKRKKNEKEGDGHRSLTALVSLGSAGPVSALGVTLPTPRPAGPFLLASGRFAASFLGLRVMTSSKITSSSDSSGESTAIESGLEVPSRSFAFAFSSASLARSLNHSPLRLRILSVKSSLEVPTDSFFQSTSRSAFGGFRFVYGRVIRPCAKSLWCDNELTRIVWNDLAGSSMKTFAKCNR